MLCVFALQKEANWNNAFFEKKDYTPTTLLGETTNDEFKEKFYEHILKDVFVDPKKSWKETSRKYLSFFIFVGMVFGSRS
jgi:hypothetical protein